MKHIIRPYEDQVHAAIDMNDPKAAATAVEIRFPDTFSDKAWRVINHLDSTAFLFVYKGRFVVTDESLYLTAHGDGTGDAPFGFPRCECNSLDAVESWLEAVADEYDRDGSIPGWATPHEDEDEAPVIVAVEARTFYNALTEAFRQGYTTIFCRRTHLHMPLELYIEEISDEDGCDPKVFARFGDMIVDLTDAWKEEAEIYELE